ARDEHVEEVARRVWAALRDVEGLDRARVQDRVPGPEDPGREGEAQREGDTEEQDDDERRTTSERPRERGHARARMRRRPRAPHPSLPAVAASGGWSRGIALLDALGRRHDLVPLRDRIGRELLEGRHHPSDRRVGFGAPPASTVRWTRSISIASPGCWRPRDARSPRRRGPSGASWHGRARRDPTPGPAGSPAGRDRRWQ